MAAVAAFDPWEFAPVALSRQSMLAMCIVRPENPARTRITLDGNLFLRPISNSSAACPRTLSACAIGFRQPRTSSQWQNSATTPLGWPMPSCVRREWLRFSYRDWPPRRWAARWIRLRSIAVPCTDRRPPPSRPPMRCINCRTVFAVAWRGPRVPDLQQALGTYFDRYSAAVKVRSGGHNHFELRQTDLVVQAGGHMRAFVGRAYLPSAIPAGVSLADLHS